MSARILTVEDVFLTIDPEFDAVLPAASKNENEDLRMLVEEEGRFTSPIVFWKHGGKNLIVDGMRRFKLWQSLPDGTTVKPPTVEEREFKSREHASDWIKKVQCSRRNAGSQTVSLLRGRWAIQKAESSPAPNKRQPAQKPPGRPRKTERQAAQQVAKKTGVSVRTVQRDVEFVRAVDAIGKINSKFKADMEAGRIKVPRETVLAISQLPTGDIGSALTNVRFGRKWNDGICENHQPAAAVHEGNGKATPAPEPEVSPMVEATKALKTLAAAMKSSLWQDEEKQQIAVQLRKLADKIDPPGESSGKFKKPTVADVKAYCDERENKVDPQAFVDFYESKGWMVGKVKMKDWRAAVRTWEKDRSSSNGRPAKGINDDAFAEVFGAQR